MQVNIAGSKEKIDARQGSLVIKNYFTLISQFSFFKTQKDHDFENSILN